MKNSKVLAGILTGVTAGVLLGILFAPNSGKRTRRQIALRGNGVADDVKGKFDEILSTINNKYEVVLKGAGNIVDNGKAKYNLTKEEIKNIIS